MKITTLLTVFALAFTVSVASAQSDKTTKDGKKECCKKECVANKDCKEKKCAEKCECKEGTKKCCQEGKMEDTKKCCQEGKKEGAKKNSKAEKK